VATLLDLANSLEKKAAAINAAASQLAVDTALAIVGDLVYHTPVDTTKALSNWTVTLDAPASDYLPAFYPGKGGETQVASAQEALALAKAVLAKKQPGQTIFISNNAPYIVRLNDGYSGQQPAGFVERAVLIGRNMQSNFKIKE